MRKIFFYGSFVILLFTACSQESEPYKDENKTISKPYDQGYIRTH